MPRWNGWWFEDARGNVVPALDVPRLRGLTSRPLHRTLREEDFAFRLLVAVFDGIRLCCALLCCALLCLGTSNCVVSVNEFLESGSRTSWWSGSQERFRGSARNLAIEF